MNIKRTAKFHKKLTLKQIKHLKEMKISLRVLPKFVESMFEKSRKKGDHFETCWDCVEILNRIENK